IPLALEFFLNAGQWLWKLGIKKLVRMFPQRLSARPPICLFSSVVPVGNYVFQITDENRVISQLQQLGLIFQNCRLTCQILFRTFARADIAYGAGDECSLWRFKRA